MLAKGLLAGSAFVAAGAATWHLATLAEPTEAPRAKPRALPAEAKPDIDGFLQAVRSGGGRYFAVRTRLAARDGGLVPVWVDVHRCEGDVLVGSVGSAAGRLCGRRPGDPIRLRASLADDWLIVDRRGVQGGLTLTQR